MLISPINNFISANYNTNFKGLWGETHYDDRTESEYFIHDKTYEYYPFSDEKEEEIEAVKNKNSAYNEDIPGKGLVANPWVHLDSVIIKVMPVLPFTSKEFVNYTLNRLSDAKRSIVENFIKDKKLTIMKKY